jgi:hypothetical protein
MFFLVVPLCIFVISSGIVFFISFKKLGYLKKLSADHDHGSTTVADLTTKQFLYQMLPEVFDYFQKVDIATHKSSFLLEFEKFLRKARLIFLKIDNLSNTLIHKIRASHLREAQKSQEKIEAQKIAELPIAIGDVDVNLPVDLKKKEHNLIIEIAKNPKNPVLYKNLGDLYIETKQWNYAHESFSSALKLDPTIKGVKRKLELSDKMSQVRGN